MKPLRTIISERKARREIEDARWLEEAKLEKPTFPAIDRWLERVNHAHPELAEMNAKSAERQKLDACKKAARRLKEEDRVHKCYTCHRSDLPHVARALGLAIVGGLVLRTYPWGDLQRYAPVIPSEVVLMLVGGWLVALLLENL